MSRRYVHAVCVRCGSEFLAYSRSVRHCSRRCANADSLSRRRALAVPDPSVFADWPSPTAAYVLGLMYADGCLSSVNGQPRLTIGMNDEQLMRSVHVLMCSPVRKLYHYRKQWLCISTNMDDIQFLRDQGLTERKSLTITWPRSLPDECFWPFVRGVFDGDGTVTVEYRLCEDGSLHARWNLTIVSGSSEFTAELCHQLNIRNVHATMFTDTSGLYHVHVSTQVDVRRMIMYMYADAAPRLVRKQVLCYAPAALPCILVVKSMLSRTGVIGYAKLRRTLIAALVQMIKLIGSADVEVREDQVNYERGFRR